MKESSQTLIFIAAAIAAVLVAASSRPTDATFEADQLIGQPLFPPFEPEAAKSMRIVRFDEVSATLSDFEVAEQEGVWSLPSKGGYPADAAEQMAQAATGVSDLEILAIATQSAADHADYGVVEPSDSLEVGQTGVGKRVTLDSQDGDALVDVVIGKEVKDAENQHFVRRTSQDVVFVVEIDPESFSTKFEDWIEDDLLDLETWDIAKVQIKDYSSQLVPQLTSRGLVEALAYDPRADLTFDYDDGESAWLPGELLGYDAETKEYEPFTLADGEELDSDKLNDLKTAVGDLKIVNVERKPSGLSSDLKAGADLFENNEAIQSLKNRGFAPTGVEDGVEIYSTEGEVIVTLKDGVEYLLRFGDLQVGGAADEAETPDEEQEGTENATSGANRYLFVMARFNDSMIEPPELEVLPEAGTDESATDSPAEKGSTTDEAATEEAAADESETEEPTETREEVDARNQQKQAEYDEKVAAAKQRVSELNERFGDWYYVIADSVYTKIALDRDQVIKEKGAEASDDAAATQSAGPLGGAANAIPGLPNIPGVNFNPAAAAPAAEQASPAAEADSSAGEEEEAPVEEPVNETAEAEATEEAAEADPPTEE